MTVRQRVRRGFGAFAAAVLLACVLVSVFHGGRSDTGWGILGFALLFFWPLYKGELWWRGFAKQGGEE